MTTFRPPDLPVATGSLLVAVTMMLVILPTAAIWALGGGAFGRLLARERARRVVSIGLGALVAATVVSVWA